MLKELREKAAALVADIRKMSDLASDAAHQWSPEDEQKWTEVNAAYDALKAQIERAERTEQLEADMAAPAGDTRVGREDVNPGSPAQDAQPAPAGPTPQQRALSLQAWMRATSGLELRDDHREAAQACGVNLRRNEFEIQLRKDYRSVRAEYRAAMSTSDGTGGETIPEGFVPNFERALLAFGGIRRVATVMRTVSGNALPWPTTNDSGNKGALIAENTQDAEQGVTTSSLTLNAYKYTSKIVKVPSELLEDSAFNLVTFCGSICGERIGRITADHYAVGTGSSQPNGIVTASTLGVTAASATDLDADEFLDLVHSVDPAYREQGGWAMHDSVVLALRKLKDGDGQYIWKSGMADGAPDRLLGYPITICQSMAGTIEASAKIALFGQLTKYLIRDVASLRLKHLVERYADYDQDAFIAYSRHDGDLLDAGSHPVKHVIMSA